jgi:signal transduction histidine kinase
MGTIAEKLSAEPNPQPWSALNRHGTKPASYWLIFGFAVVYFLAGRIGLRLAIVHPNVTAVWPGTGLALAAVLLFGDSVWPAIFLGAFFVNVTTAGSLLSSLGIAAGNTLEAVIGAYLVTRFAHGRNVFDRAEGIFKFSLFAGFLAAAISATFGTGSLLVTGFLKGADPKSVWFTWWLGDMVGALLVTPCFLLWPFRNEASARRSTPWWLASLASLIAIAWITFSGSYLPGGSDFPLKFICLPFVVWAAVELRRHELPLALVMFSVIAIGGAVSATSPSISNQSLLVLQVFLGVAAMTGLVTSAAVCERNRHEHELREARADLEVRVLERTQELEARIEEQMLTEQALQDLSARLLQVQDEERRRVARDLHDSTGQSLAALMMTLSPLAKKLAASAPEISAQLDQVTQLARSVADEVRTTSYLLHPPLLDESGLESALAWYVQGFQERSKIKVALEVSDNLGRLPPAIEIMIFRIVQECLANVLRHSKSHTVAVRLQQAGQALTLDVQDQGKGIAPDKLKAIVESRSAGVGLRGMRERLLSVNGELKVVSDKNGTLVRSIVPLVRPVGLADTESSQGQSAAHRGP